MIPVSYDPDAQCPQWTEFLTDIMCGNADMVSFLQRVVGYSLTGRTTEQCFFILYGTGANGKSVFISVLRNLLGEYAKTAEFSSFIERKNDTVRNDLARLSGARFVVGSEGDAGHALSESVVKSLTGEDTITARYLYKEYFEFVPTFKLFLVTNHKPDIKNQDRGIWRRVYLIPFVKSVLPENQNPHLVEELSAELPGILRWAVDGCRAWQALKLQPPAIVQEATEEYRQDMDILGPFLEECFLRDTDSRTPSSSIYTEYVQWCESERCMVSPHSI